MLKKVTALLLILAALLALAPAQAESTPDIRGYKKGSGYQYVQFGSYFTEENGDRKPILWRVLRSANGEAYILSELILFAAPVHGDYKNYNRNWQGSDLYAYLNGKFKNDAFTPAEQAALLVRTEDEALVTLLSGPEMRDKSIGFDSNKDRLCQSTPYASVAVNPPIFELPSPNFWKEERNQPHLYKYSVGGRKYSPWWSRTPSVDHAHEQRRVMDGGKTGILSSGNSDMGVRPVITLDLSKVTIVSGSGTQAAPYVLEADPVSTPAEAPAEPIPAVPADAVPLEVSQPENQPAPEPEPEPAPAPETEPAPAPEPEPAPAPQPEPAPAALTVPAREGGFTAGSDPRFIRAEFPPLTAEGFLPEGEAEFVYEDADAGLWLYASQTLRVQIERKQGQIDEYDGKKKVKTWDTRWYETRVFCRDKSEILDFFPVNEEKYFKKYPDVKEADEIARDNHLVVAFNTDYFNYRVTRSYEKGATSKNLKNYTIGIVIRNGQILFEKTKKENSTELPPLDAMAFYPDGSTTVHVSSTVTAQDLIKAGATDVVSFGPVLVDNGAVSYRAAAFGKVLNPRTAFGTVEPGHYVHIVADGRLSNENLKGVTCTWMAERLLEAGCQNGINLDGGASGVLIFMGKKLNKTGNYGSGVAANRDYNEMMGFGHSDLVQP